MEAWVCWFASLFHGNVVDNTWFGECKKGDNKYLEQKQICCCDIFQHMNARNSECVNTSA